MKEQLERKKINYIKEIIAIISLIVSSHYFLSFRWLKGILKSANIDNLSVITMDDLVFNFIELNYTVFLLSSLGFIWIFWWRLITMNYNEPEKTLINNIRELFRFLKKRYLKLKLFFKISIPFTIILFVIIYLLWIRPTLEFPNKFIEWFYLLIFIVIPIIYILSSNKYRTIVLGIQILGMFIWANVFISVVINKLNTTNETSKTNMSFEYNNTTIKTTDSIKIFYIGYKYLILKDSRKKDNVYLLYPTKNIGMIKFQKIKSKL